MINALKSPWLALGFAAASLATPASARPSLAFDIQSLSDEFATYQSPDLARQAVAEAIPPGTPLTAAEMTVKRAGGYCWVQRRTGAVRCSALIPVVVGDGSIDPVRWDFRLNTAAGMISNVDVSLG